MTGRERFMTALRGGTPDRTELPVLGSRKMTGIGRGAVPSGLTMPEKRSSDL